LCQSFMRIKLINMTCHIRLKSQDRYFMVDAKID
jgi:hypothetical protein